MIRRTEQRPSHRGGRAEIRENFLVKIFPEARGGRHHRGLHRFQIVADGSQTCVVSGNPPRNGDHFKHPLVAVPHGKDGQGAVVSAERERQVADLRNHVRMGEHHAFGDSGGAGGVDEGEQILRSDRGHALFRPAVSCFTLRAPLLDQIIQQPHPPARFEARVHHNHFPHTRQPGPAALEFFKGGRVFDEHHLHIRVPENVGDFRVGDVCAAGHIRRPGELDATVAQNPFDAVVGKQAHMIPLTDPEIDQGGGQCEACFVEVCERGRAPAARRGRASCEKSRAFPETLRSHPVKTGDVFRNKARARRRAGDDGACGHPVRARRV